MQEPPSASSPLITPAPPASPPHRSGAGVWLVVFALGMLLGAALLWLIVNGAADPRFETLLKGSGAVLVALLGVAALLGLVFAWGFARFLKHLHGTLEQSTTHFAQGLTAWAAGDKSAAIHHVEAMVKEGVAWYAPIRFRRFLIQMGATLFIAFAGVMGSSLIFHQNKLLKEQNEKIDRQTDLLAAQNKLLEKQTEFLKSQIEKTDLQIVTAEAQRRADITNEIFAVLKDVEIYAQSKDAKRELVSYCKQVRLIGDLGCNPKEDKLLVLPDGLTGRIRTIAASATPYYTIEPVRVGEDWQFKTQEKPLSRQRGQLLIGLAASKVKFDTLNADFSHADLREAQLEGANLAGVNLQKADLQNANLMWAKLLLTNLQQVNLQGINLRGAALLASQLNGVKFGKEADLFFADLRWADLRKTDLRRVDLRGVKLLEADLREANLQGTQLNGAHLFGVKLQYALFEEASLTETDLIMAHLLYELIDGSPVLPRNKTINPNVKYRLYPIDLHRTSDLNRTHLPEGWKVKGQKSSGNEDDPPEWILETPWGDYADLMAEQAKNGFIDLYTRLQMLR